MKRLREIDVAKGIVILLVVLGHLVTFDGVIWSWIFSFHMPFFFLMSGYCSKKSNYEMPFLLYFSKIVKSLLIPAIVCRILYLITGVFGMDISLSLKDDLAKVFLQPSEWFLSSLFIARLLFWFYYRMQNKIGDSLRNLFTLISIAFIFYSAIWWNDIGLHYKPNYFPFPIDTSLIALCFIIIGFEIHDREFIVFSRNARNITKLCLFFCGFISLIFIKNDSYVNVSDMYFGRSDLFFIVNACFWSFLICYISYKAIQKNSRIIKTLELLGRNTIIIYIGHTILFTFLNKILLFYTGVEYVPMHKFNNFLVCIYFLITCAVFIIISFFWEHLKHKIHKLKAIGIFIVLFAAFSIGKYDSYAESPEFLQGGDGTAESPYLIESVDDFCEFRDLVNAGTSFSGQFVKQTTDIDLSGIENFEPIGVFGTNNYFYGCYDGNGHSISNININRTDNCGLFGMLGGKIMNLEIESGYITGACAGSFASHAVPEGTAAIFNCHNKATIHGSIRAGGIADNFPGTIMFCVNSGTITSDTGASYGIVSYSANQLAYCYCVEQIPYGQDFQGSVLDTESISSIDYNSVDLANKINYYLGKYCAENRNDSFTLWEIQNDKIKYSEQNISLFYFLGYANKLLTRYGIELLCVIGAFISFILILKQQEEL